jgi:hypothetical protein
MGDTDERNTIRVTFEEGAEEGVWSLNSIKSVNITEFNGNETDDEKDQHSPQSYTFKRMRTLDRPNVAFPKLQDGERPSKNSIHARLMRFGFLRSANR